MRFTFERLDLHTRNPFAIARTASIPVRQSIFVRVEEDGLEGWGEAPVTTPYYGETAETALSVLPGLGEVVREASKSDPFALERIEAAVTRSIGGNAAAKAGLSAALHDLVGKRLGIPIWRMWGLAPSAPRSSFTIAIDTVEEMRKRVREAAEYPILKIKVGTPHDEEILAMIRDEAPTKAIRVDANTGWTAKQAIAALPMLDDFSVELIEQPVDPDDLDGLSAVSKVSPIPVVADEACKTSADIPKLAGAADVINIKLAKCGSLREAVRMVHYARAAGLEVMLGCMIETTLGIAAAVQLAPLVDYVDLDGAALLASDPFLGPGIDTDGSIRFNDRAGLGVTSRVSTIGTS